MQAICVPSIEEIYEYAISLAAKKSFERSEPMLLTRKENGSKTRIAFFFHGNSEIEEVTLFCRQDKDNLPFLVVKRSPHLNQEKTNATLN